MFGGIKKCCNFALEFNNGILLVVWMSGLVTGLQNRLRRFESANHLNKCERRNVFTLFLLYPSIKFFDVKFTGLDIT